MQPIEGIHHITLITGDAPRNVDFYARVLGLRLVKKTVNQDDPGVYHLFYADEHGSPGADITFFEYPGARPGHAGAGMIDTIVHRVAGEDALDFWADRLGGEGIATERLGGALRFADPEGMGHELSVVQSADAPLIAAHLEVPEQYALRGFEAVRARVADPARSEALVREVLGFKPLGEGDWEARGAGGGSCSLRRPSAGSLVGARCITWHGRFCAPRSPSGGRTWRPREPTRRRSSTASTSSRCTFESRAGCCTNSRRWTAPGSPPTRIRTRSARGCRCRRFWSRAAPRSSRR